MKAACAFSAICTVFGLAVSALAEPSSPACEGAIERISQAQKALVPFRRTLEMVRAHESGAHGEATSCIGTTGRGGGDPQPCRTSQWRVSPPTKDDVTAANHYRQEREAFDKLFQQAKRLCLREP